MNQSFKLSFAAIALAAASSLSFAADATNSSAAGARNQAAAPASSGADATMKAGASPTGKDGNSYGGTHKPSQKHRRPGTTMQPMNTKPASAGETGAEN